MFWIYLAAAQEYQRPCYMNRRFKYYEIPESVIKMDFHLPREDVLVQHSQQWCVYPY